MKRMRQWFARWFRVKKIMNLFVERNEERYIDVLAIPQNMDELHIQARLMDRQRTLRIQMWKENKNILSGYKPPQPAVANRVDVHMEKAGVTGKEKSERYGSSVKPVLKDQSKKTAKS